MKRPFGVLVAVLVAALVGSGCSSTLSDAATVNYDVKGESQEVHVTRDELLSEVGKIVKNKPFAKLLKQNDFTVSSDLTADTKISAIWLTQLIRNEAIDVLFAARHLRVTPAMKASAAKDVVQTFPQSDPPIFDAFDAKYRAELIDRQARTAALLASYTDMSDAAGRKFYKAHASSFACASGKNVAHILVPTEAAAQGILKQLDAGGSFSALAQQNSTDTGSGARGGDLGCFAKGQFVPAFEAATDAAPFDKAVGPVKSQYGYHLILVTHWPTTYEGKKNEVLAALAQQGGSDARTAIDALLKRFKVHVDPRFGKWGLVTTAQGQQQYEVTPPKAPEPSTKREGTTTTTAAAPPTTPGSP